MGKQKSRPLGHWFAEGRAVLILRNTGQVLNNVKVLEREFRIETPDLGTLAIPTRDIKTIVYKNLPTFPTDMLRTIRGTELNGNVLNDPVAVDAAELGGKTKIAKAKLLSIIW